MLRVTGFATFVLLSLSCGSDAFQPIRLSSSPSVAMRSSRADLEEFDFILGEGNHQTNDGLEQHAVIHSRRKIKLSGNSRHERVTVLASSTFASPGLEEEVTDAEEEVDPYADILEENPVMSRYEQKELSFGEKFGNKVKEMDAQDIISTLIVPGIFAAAGLRWSARKAATKVEGKAEETLDAFANEMVYHDGDFEEMKLCMNSYGKQLVWLGPNKNTAMLKRYLTLYAKKRIVSPQAISSLSYVFSLFKLSEEKAAKILVELCKQMGNDALSSAGKLLFFGSRILKSAEGKAALEPIRDLIKSSYRGEKGEVAESMVETSQQAMAEAAYRTAVNEGGKDQTTLTVGWEVLGLDKDTATSIFEEEASEGFISYREKLYGNQSQRYDDDGNRIDEEGNLEDPENAIVGKKDDAQPTSNVMRCKSCGYTLFIAKGREQKFFGESFKCPECGAAKDQFEPTDLDA